MNKTDQPSRRDILKAGIAGMPVLAAGASPREAGAAENRKRITVAAFMGDYCHNPISREINLRAMLAKMDWRILCTPYSEFLTPELIGEADLLINHRWNRSQNAALGYVPGGVAESRPKDAPFMSPEQEEAIFDNVRNRGMGLLSLHCAFWNPTPMMQEIYAHETGFHPCVQPVLIKKFNRDHPITRGMEPWVEDDEQFMTRINNPGHTILFYSEGTRDHRESVSGWCFDYGKGRIAHLLPGHTEFVWEHPGFQQLILRSALWLMKMPIPDNTADLVARKAPNVRPVGGIGKAGLSTNI